MRTNDVFVLDLGFRNVVKDLGEKNLKVLIPALKGKRKQLSTEESNQSRFVTKIRWAVEAVHGMLKQKYRLLGHKIDSKLVPSIEQRTKNFQKTYYRKCMLEKMSAIHKLLR